MPAPTVANIRSDLPEFASAALYPPAVITYWLSIAKLLLNPNRWDDTPAATGEPTMLYFGAEMFVAHNLVLERQAEAAASRRGIPGQASGPISSKSVGPLSISYDTGAAAELEAGHWNLTVYGQRFVRLARMVGAGGIQVGVGFAPFGSMGAWPGPWPYPLPGGSGFGS